MPIRRGTVSFVVLAMFASSAPSEAEAQRARPAPRAHSALPKRAVAPARPIRPYAAKRASVVELVARHRVRAAPGPGERLRFRGVGGKDVYNPTRPFRVRGKRVLAARVESRQSETDSQVWFFEERRGAWVPVRGAPRLPLQDPFVSKVGGELVIGGVEVTRGAGEALSYKTVFYRGGDLARLRRFAAGPPGMKDIRLAELPDRRIVVLTRPQGRRGGRGKIGLTVISRLDQLTPEIIERAPIIRGQFHAEDWGGGNEIHVLGPDRVGVIGHVARFDGRGNRHYYPVAFTIDLAAGQASPMKVLLERKNLRPGAAKRPDLADVVFAGGLERDGRGGAVLYVGAGDAEVHRVQVPDPFIR